MSTGDEDDDGYERQRKAYGSVSGSYRVASTDTGLITLVPAVAKTTHFIQQVHADVTTGATSELWGLQDGATTPVPIVGNLSAAAVAHADRDFGANGVPCTEGTAFTLNVSGATGAIGWIAWEGYRKLTRAAVVSPPLVRYSELVIADGASYYWRLEEMSGTTAVDSIGGVNGTISGGVTLNQPGALSDGSKGMTFNGSTGKILTATTATLLTPYTVEAWVKSTSSASQPVWSTPFLGGSEQGTGGFTAAGKASCSLVNVAQTLVTNVSGTRTINDDQWHHVVYRIQSAVVDIYVDGVLDKTLATTFPVGGMTRPMDIGHYDNPVTWWNGSLDDVALYPYAVTAAQVSAHYLAGITR